jgi:hypothetical protein
VDETHGVVLKRKFALAFAVLTFVGAPVAAAVLKGAVWSATYVAAYQPHFGTQGPPFSGIMKIKVDHGIISGSYDATSSRPDPLYGRMITVSGGMSHGNVTLRFNGTSFNMTNGTIDEHGTISGTANYNGKLYNFLAKVKSSP